MAAAIPWGALEAILSRDPARRGLGAWQDAHGLLFPGALEGAARSLHERGTRVCIVTGFCVVDAPRPAAETDGPPGALYLARALAALGRDVVLLSDAYGLPLLRAGLAEMDLPGSLLVEFPFEADAHDRGTHAEGHNTATDAWIAEFFGPTGRGAGLSHLLSIERVGPSHTLASVPAESRDAFAAEVPPDSRDVCHNMRGLDITAFTAKTHRLFEHLRAHWPDVETIGIGDGGNELGLGSVPWQTIRQAVTFGPAGRIACRIATQHTLVAGVSNWGGYALAASVCTLAGRSDLLAPWDCAAQGRLIEHLVRETDAVDGATRQRAATVDGLPLVTYLQTLAGIRQALGQAP